MEALAVDQVRLMREVYPEAAVRLPEDLSDRGIVERMRTCASAIAEHSPCRWVKHPSDTVRAWACFAVVGEGGLSAGERLKRVRPFADDGHFSVREWAWIALRPAIAADLPDWLVRLRGWRLESSERLRRFAVEATRPRGV